LIPKPTENTITSLLKEELETLGVKALLFIRVSTPVGDREVDLWCYNSGRYPLETRSTERELMMAVSKVYNDYIRWRKFLSVDGGFVPLYPEELREPMPPEDV
jgi:hypothetical protein